MTPTETLSEERLDEIERTIGDQASAQSPVYYTTAREVRSLVTLAREALASRRTPVSGEVTEALQKIIALDQVKERTVVEFDPAGSLYEVKDVDGPCAKIARAVLPAAAAQADCEARVRSALASPVAAEPASEAAALAVKPEEV